MTHGLPPSPSPWTARSRVDPPNRGSPGAGSSRRAKASGPEASSAARGATRNRRSDGTYSRPASLARVQFSASAVRNTANSSAVPGQGAGPAATRGGTALARAPPGVPLPGQHLDPEREVPGGLRRRDRVPEIVLASRGEVDHEGPRERRLPHPRPGRQRGEPARDRDEARLDRRRRPAVERGLPRRAHPEGDRRSVGEEVERVGPLRDRQRDRERRGVLRPSGHDREAVRGLGGGCRVRPRREVEADLRRSLPPTARGGQGEAREHGEHGRGAGHRRSPGMRPVYAGAPAAEPRDPCHLRSSCTVVSAGSQSWIRFSSRSIRRSESGSTPSRYFCDGSSPCSRATPSRPV